MEHSGKTAFQKEQFKNCFTICKASILFFRSWGTDGGISNFVNQWKEPRELGYCTEHSGFQARRGKKVLKEKTCANLSSGGPTRKKNKESDELDPPFFLSSSNTTWIDSTGSPGLRLRGTGINGMNWWDEISQARLYTATTFFSLTTPRILQFHNRM